MYPGNDSAGASTKTRSDRPRQSLGDWANDLCKVKQCRDGFVSMEVKGYETLFACPACDRSKRDLHPYQSIPSAKKWEGKVELYTEVEMYERRKDRLSVIENLRRGAAKMPMLETEDVGGPF